MESDDSLCRAISSTHDDSPSLEVKGIRIGNRTLMPLKPGANGEYRDVTTGVGVCSTYGTSIEGNTFYPGLTQTSNSGSEPDFFWTDGTEVASQFNVPHNTKGVLCSSQGRYEFQLWTLQFKPVGIMRVTNSESKEQTELVQNALLKIGDTEQRKQLIQALESQTVTRPQKAILEVKYKDDMFLITSGLRSHTVKVESLNEKKGVYVWIHDGTLIAGGTILTDEFRDIFGIKEREKELRGKWQQ